MRCYLQIFKQSFPEYKYCYSVCFTKYINDKSKTNCNSINDKPTAFYFDKEIIYSKVWMRNNLHHRINGPAIFLKGKEYYLLNGNSYDKEIWEEMRKKYVK